MFFSPDHRAVRGIKTTEFAGGAERIDFPIGVRRRRPRPFVAVVFRKLRRPAVRPQFTPGFNLISGHHLIA
jgi:hypothetical protein